MNEIAAAVVLRGLPVGGRKPGGSSSNRTSINGRAVQMPVTPETRGGCVKAVRVASEGGSQTVAISGNIPLLLALISLALQVPLTDRR